MNSSSAFETPKWVAERYSSKLGDEPHAPREMRATFRDFRRLSDRNWTSRHRARFRGFRRVRSAWTPAYHEEISCGQEARTARAQAGRAGMPRCSTEESDLLHHYLAGEIEVESGPSRLRRFLFSSRRRLISARSSVSLFGLRSIAACSHNSSQRCLFSPCMKPP